MMKCRFTLTLKFYSEQMISSSGAWWCQMDDGNFIIYSLSAYFIHIRCTPPRRPTKKHTYHRLLSRTLILHYDIWHFTMRGCNIDESASFVSSHYARLRAAMMAARCLSPQPRKPKAVDNYCLRRRHWYFAFIIWHEEYFEGYKIARLINWWRWIIYDGRHDIYLSIDCYYWLFRHYRRVFDGYTMPPAHAIPSPSPTTDDIDHQELTAPRVRRRPYICCL